RCDRQAGWCRRLAAARFVGSNRERALPQTPAKAGRLRAKWVRGGLVRLRAISLAQRRRVSRAWRTTFPTVLSSRKRSFLGEIAARRDAARLVSQNLAHRIAR